MAVSALTVLLSNCLEESQFVSAPPARKRLILEGPLGGAGGAALLGSDEEEGGGFGGVGGLVGRWVGKECCMCVGGRQSVGGTIGRRFGGGT